MAQKGFAVITHKKPMPNGTKCVIVKDGVRISLNTEESQAVMDEIHKGFV